MPNQCCTAFRPNHKSLAGSKGCSATPSSGEMNLRGDQRGNFLALTSGICQQEAGVLKLWQKQQLVSAHTKLSDKMLQLKDRRSYTDPTQDKIERDAPSHQILLNMAQVRLVCLIDGKRNQPLCSISAGELDKHLIANNLCLALTHELAWMSSPALC